MYASSPMRWPTAVEKTFPKAPTLKNEAIVEQILGAVRRLYAMRLKCSFIYFLSPGKLTVFLA